MDTQAAAIAPHTTTHPPAHALLTGSSLSAVTLAGVASIGRGTFYDCTSLEAVTIPDGVVAIGEEAFCGCLRLATVEIPSSVKSIGASAFEGCFSLPNVLLLPDSVTAIGEGAFPRHVRFKRGKQDLKATN